MKTSNRTPAQDVAAVLRALSTPPLRHMNEAELLHRTGLPKWRLNGALDGLIGKGLVASGYPEAGESTQEFFWLVMDPPEPYWLDEEDEEPNVPSEPLPEVPNR